MKIIVFKKKKNEVINKRAAENQNHMKEHHMKMEKSVISVKKNLNINI